MNRVQRLHGFTKAQRELRTAQLDSSDDEELGEDLDIGQNIERYDLLDDEILDEEEIVQYLDTDSELDENPGDIIYDTESDLEIEHHNHEIAKPKLKRSREIITEESTEQETKTYHNDIHRSTRWALVFLGVILSASMYSFLQRNNEIETTLAQPKIAINLKQVEEIPKKYPQLSLTDKELRIIKTRLMVMRKEISVLMLLGQSRDTQCIEDPTYCIGRDIANSTESQFNYIDASSASDNGYEVAQKLAKSFTGIPNMVLIDSLEKLPGSQVMNLFQYIDRIEEIDQRRGMLLFVVYTGKDQNGNKKLTYDKTAETAEKILVDNWSPTIPKDKLTSVISRMCRSIIKVY